MGGFLVYLLIISKQSLFDVPPQSELEIEVELFILECILYLAAVVKIVLRTWFNIDSQLWNDVKLCAKGCISRPLRTVVLRSHDLSVGLCMIFHIEVSLATSCHIGFETLGLPEIIANIDWYAHVMQGLRRYLCRVVR